MSGDMRELAPSMWAFPAWFWRMSGTCAMYVPERQLDIEKKHGCKPAQKISKNMSFLGLYLPRTTCLKMELRHPSPVFCLWHRWRKSRIEPCTSRLEYIHRIISPYITMHKSFTHTHIYIYIYMCSAPPPEHPIMWFLHFPFWGIFFVFLMR